MLPQFPFPSQICSSQQEETSFTDSLPFWNSGRPIGTTLNTVLYFVGIKDSNSLEYNFVIQDALSSLDAMGEDISPELCEICHLHASNGLSVFFCSYTESNAVQDLSTSLFQATVKMQQRSNKDS